MSYTAVIKQSGSPVTIPGFVFTDRSVAEGYLSFHYGTSFDPGPARVYDCGPYDAVISNGATVVATINIPHHFWNSEWWYDITPVTTIVNAPAALISAGLVPPIGDTGLPGMTLPRPGDCVFGGYMQLTSGITGFEPSTGGRPDLGIVTAWDAEALITGNFSNTLAVSQMLPTMPIWNHDDTVGSPTGKVIDLVAKPYVTSYNSNALLGDPYWLGPFPQNPADIRPVPVPLPPSNPSTPDTAHMVSHGVVAMSTLAPRYVRALQMRVVAAIDADPYYVSTFGFASCIISQMRGTARALRELFYCYQATRLAEIAGTLPSDCLPSTTWKTIIDNHATGINSTYVNAAVGTPRNKFHIWTDGIIAWWQNDELLQVLAMYANYFGNATWGPIYLWTLKNLMVRVNGDGLSQTPVCAPTAYWMNTTSDSTLTSDGYQVQGTTPYASYALMWEAYFAGQVAGNDLSGQNVDYYNAAQVAKAHADPTNGNAYIKPDSSQCWTFGALAYAVYVDTHGPMTGLVTAAYPNLAAAYAQQYAMMKKQGYLIPACSIYAGSPPAVSVVPVVVTPPPAAPPPPPVVVIPVDPPPAPPVPPTNAPPVVTGTFDATALVFNLTTNQSDVVVDLTGRVPAGSNHLLFNLNGTGDTMVTVIWPDKQPGWIIQQANSPNGGKVWQETHASGDKFVLYNCGTSLIFNGTQIGTIQNPVPAPTPHPPPLPPLAPGEPAVADLTLAHILKLDGSPDAAVVNLVGEVTAGGAVVPLGGMPMSTVLDGGGNPTTTPAVSVVLAPIEDGVSVVIQALRAASFLVSIQAPPYPDGVTVAPYVIAGTVANAEATLLLGTQIS